MRHVAITLVMLLAATVPAAAQAQNADEARRLMVNLFTQGNAVTLMNQRGEPGEADYWEMHRTVSGVSELRPCFMRLQAPQVLSKSPASLNPVAYYGIEWASVRNVTTFEGAPFVFFQAGHMADNETGAFVLPDLETTWELEAAMKVVARACQR